MHKLKIAILGSTRGTSMQPIIEAIKNDDLNASLDIVISDKSDAYILERAKNANIENIYINPKNKTKKEFDAEIMKILDKKNIDLVLLIGYMRIISINFINKWRNKILNVHPSLLPAFAGKMDLNVHEEVLKAGVKETGCTIHIIDEGIDTGPIIIQKSCPVTSKDTPETLKSKVQKLEGEAFIEVIKKKSYEQK
ncbi:MAG: phosphoribosylglycinamide formyltransferase [Candidatus Magasanikbacteria bacterium RIFCSPHIGHO2_01_FULL_33_34]|uniref:Phosphoribosylglycinamide formyltransferase n=1 Tax=Candidatus Magasanikbacteria bacterium RIFCSPHIGHO2_01_FULL_33_34 TaxID=1798671 RepID=A0A1F6LHM5_9BACT|nr:MAG: phosphoribosylglycinamide formyltransferase [Candidatus Magasanikbacteria bacterium RIFCSPHIGHO2_01_FULL_33_34]OGH65089.1 MAG: phosphoribosylglycinamide formyltransferase [Candidatus Magasanikbacteria bacterium RIFCSPHIGHO2_02_FULL_33_17]OGH75367.1 MAG: phosphoribosylglycinamide formyltransferase [Candidatus Magasanikbacteria bacterium RIFCSPLOWO2_01_FULL_33_34]OGH81727.1 MAG: phosphoribosylglycinamide formyltransferase [Candidatus Magasanikbacteria bacterium RIFCSPLOWO2_12_FULL_34_7]